MAKKVDLVYDRFVAGDKLRSSDKYEVLAAIVFSILESSDATVHDMRLLGGTGVRHQIDAVVGAGDTTRRVLVECKDYGKKAGLPLVRNFWGAVEDIKPDESFVVTTVGFTEPAVKYAMAKGIRLAILRPPEGEDDWGDLIREINFELRFSTPVQEPQIGWFVPEDQRTVLANWSGVGRVAATDVQVVHADGTIETPEQLGQKYVELPEPGSPGVASGQASFEERALLRIAGEPDLQVTGFMWRQRFEAGVHKFTVGEGVGGLTSELMLRTLDGGIHRMFSNKDIAAWTLDRNRRVVPRARL